MVGKTSPPAPSLKGRGASLFEAEAFGEHPDNHNESPLPRGKGPGVRFPSIAAGILEAAVGADRGGTALQCGHRVAAARAWLGLFTGRADGPPVCSHAPGRGIAFRARSLLHDTRSFIVHTA